jgi:L-alanine-DL-glutamate epimerase-like enolase superfamily enzyme
MEEKYDLAWVEEPARRWDYQGLRLVSQQVTAAVATGENVNSVADFYALVANQAVDVLNVAAGHSGVTGCRQVANLALAYSLPVSMMNCQANFMAHVAAALPNHIGMEVVDPGREQCLKFDNHIEDGYIVLGNEPGFGISVDEAALAALKAHPPKGRGTFPLPRREGAGRYIVPLRPGEVPWPRSSE